MEQSNKNMYAQIEIFYRRRWMLILPILLCTGVAVGISFMLPSYYRSSTLILLDRQQVPDAYVTPTDTTPFGQRLNTISQQIMSRTKLEKIINDFNLYKGGDNLLSKIRGWFSKSTKPLPLEDIIVQMRKDIQVKVIGGGGGKGGDAFSVSYSGKDPHTTMQVTNTLASLFIEENLKIREEYAEGTSEFITNELEKARHELETQEQAVRAFKEKYMGSLPEQLGANLKTLDRLQLELQSVATSIKNAEDRKVFLENQLGIVASSSTDPIASPIANPLEAELTKLKNELNTLLSMYKENYPDVVITRNRIKEIEEMLASAKKTAGQKPNEHTKLEQGDRRTEIYADLATVKSLIETFKKREAEIRKQIKIYEERVEETPASEQRMANLFRDYEISKRNYQTLLEKRFNARVAENLEKRQKGERFRILDPANLPERPYKPDRLKITLFGTMGGTGIGVGMVLLFEFLNPAFRRPEDFAGVLPQPVLTTIPLFSIRSTKSKSSPEKKFKIIKGRKV